ncbi:MAG: hypothetical protein BGO98_35785 [Myxococcales bacterium 68-20]|nr:MAG: hypothetical protein BGO98_35785 [Myxococcales bacterium 68-20]
MLTTTLTTTRRNRRRLAHRRGAHRDAGWSVASCSSITSSSTKLAHLAQVSASARPPNEGVAVGSCSGAEARELFFDTVEQAIVSGARTPRHPAGNPREAEHRRRTGSLTRGHTPPLWVCSRSRMRRYIPALLLTLTAIAFPLAGCSELIDKLKNRGAGDDGGADAAVAELTADAETAPAPAPTETAAEPIPTTTTTAAPTIAPTTTATTKPVATDAGVVDSGAKVVDAAAPAVTDAGATKTDSGAAPAPVPTPTFKLPSGLLDGGLFRFDAGGFRLPGT